MKNLKKQLLAITAMMLMTGFITSTLFAQVPQNQKDRQNRTTEDQQMGTQDEDRQDRTTQDQQQWGTQDQNRHHQMDMQDGEVNYSDEIQENDLPQAVSNSLDELYPAHEISEVYRGDDDSYKVKVKNQNDVAVVFYNSDGDFLRARNISDGMGQASPQEQSQRTQDQYGTQQGTQGQWGTQNQQGTQGQHGTQGTQQGRTQDQGTHGQHGTMNQQGTQQGTQGQWGTQDDDRRTQDQETQGQYGTQGTQQKSQGQYGTQNQQGTQQGTQSQWGTRDDDNRTTQDTTTRQQEMQGTQGQYGEGTHDRTQGTYEGTEGQSHQGEGMGTQNDRTRGQYGTQVERRTQGEAFPQGQAQRTMDADYSEEINENELPDNVTTSLDELYPAHNVEKVYRGDDNSYKVKVKNNNDKAVVYYSSNGDFVKAEDISDKDRGKDKGKDKN